MKRNGFTLVELLVTVAIIAVLGSLATVGYQSVRENARMTREVNAARNLIAGYLLHASDHNGQVLPGYRADPSATNLDGRPLPFPTNARYPWRLTPYIPKIEGVMLFNGNESALDSHNRDYLVSVRPNLGINATLVGGHHGSGSPLPPNDRVIDELGNFHLTRLPQASRPELLIVFASARSDSQHNPTGYYEVRPPNLLSPVWSSTTFSPDQPASAHGFVDFRWKNRAVAATLAGNVELLDEAEMRDMRRWSIQAADANAPDFRITRQ